MPNRVRPSGGDGQAKTVQQPSNDPVSTLGDFRQEVGESLARALRVHKAETIGAAIDRKRSTIYRWAAEPEEVPLAVIPTLSTFDPDPEFLARVAGMLLAIHAQRALAREAMGRSLQVFHEISPGRWAR